MKRKHRQSVTRKRRGRRRPLRVGLTGGIASGKSTVADMFAELGVPVIDTDKLSRDVVEPGQPALAEIRHHFGESVIDSSGGLDRAAMRRIVFADPAERVALEAILHPRIRDAAMEQSRTLGGDYQLIVVPLMVESPMRHSMDRILAVDVAESIQLERLMARDAESAARAEAMMAAQASRAERLAIADDVINNEGDLAETRQQVVALHERYQEEARNRAR